MDALRQTDAWDVPFAAAGVTRFDATVATRGDARQAVRLASVSKPVTALAVLVAAEEGVLDLDDPAGPPGATVRHLLAHASGLPFQGEIPIAPPGRRRIYSNEGFGIVGRVLEERAEMPFADYVRAAVCDPLGLGLDPHGHPGAGMHACLEDVLALGRELLAPTLIARETLTEMTWGLGVELKDGKDPHWTGTRTSPRTFGHFGGSGTFLWVDPEAGVACACLTTREFDAWAKDAWPRLSDAVLDELAA
jgi:CubicO group peptidase (beta-lactamase class C family)